MSVPVLFVHRPRRLFQVLFHGLQDELHILLVIGLVGWGGVKAGAREACISVDQYYANHVDFFICMRRYLIFVTAALGLLMYSIDTTAVAVAFPNFIEELGANVLWAAWTISIFYIGVTMAMPVMGTLSDTFGRKKVLLLSLMLFTASSLACGLAPNIYVLIAFRFLQGIGGASFLPAASGIVSDHFPENRERAIGLFTSVFLIGGIVGPNLGGWIVSRYSWRYIFYINLPIGIVLIGLIMMLLKDSKAFSVRHIDLAGTSLMSGGILFLMFALNFIGQSLSMNSLIFFAIFVILSVLFLLLFLHHESKAANPIIDIALLKSKPFLAANLLNICIGAGVFGVFAFVPLYATSVHNLSTLASGMILTPRSFAVIFASGFTSFLLKRWGYRWPMVLGLSIASLATICLAPGLTLWRTVGVRPGAAETISFLMLVTGIGMGLALPASNNACIELMPERVATIVGLRGMFRTIGGVLGTSFITLILHVSSTSVNGFMLTFVSCGIGLLLAIPLVFLMPTGKTK